MLSLTTRTSLRTALRPALAVQCLPNSCFRWQSTTTDETTMMYESPMSGPVTRLRAVSLLSAFTGTIGLPAFCAIRGIPDVEVGILAFGMTFVGGSMASTAAIHFVFAPYVYQIEKIPVRQCHSSSTLSTDAEAPTKDDNKQQGGEISNDDKDYLLKAVSRSLFLTRVETVFNPDTDVTPYKGLRPLCNFVAKGVPLYVHQDFIHNTTLRKQLHLEDKIQVAEPTKPENLDDFF